MTQPNVGGLDEDLPLCEVPEPSTPGGIEVWYRNRLTGELGQIEIRRGTADEVAPVVASFGRVFTECDLAPLGFTESSVRSIEPAGADEAVAIVGSLAQRDELLRFVMGISTYGETTMAVIWGAPMSSEVDVEQGLELVVRWIELVAAKL